MSLDPKDRESLRTAGRMSAVGWEFAISVVGCFLLGWWADKKLGTGPVLMLVGLGVGMFAGFWTLFKATRAMAKEAEEIERNEREHLKPPAGDTAKHDEDPFR